MGNSKASSVAPRTAVENPDSVEFAPDQVPEQPRDFHFAVTWFTLFAHLDPIEATGPRPRIDNSSPTLALVPVPASMPLVEQRTDHESSAAWEMVVPKMIRTSQRTFQPAESAEPSAKKPELL